MSKILAIDYGLKKVGLAYSDESELIAFPDRTIFYNSLEFLIKEIKRKVNKKRISKIILGLPIKSSGQEKLPIKKIEIFKKELEKVVGLPVFLENEVYTTSLAKNKIKDSGKKALTTDKDALAAANILQSYLDRKKKLMHNL